MPTPLYRICYTWYKWKNLPIRWFTGEWEAVCQWLQEAVEIMFEYYVWILCLNIMFEIMLWILCLKLCFKYMLYQTEKSEIQPLQGSTWAFHQIQTWPFWYCLPDQFQYRRLAGRPISICQRGSNSKISCFHRMLGDDSHFRQPRDARGIRWSVWQRNWRMWRWGLPPGKCFNNKVNLQKLKWELLFQFGLIPLIIKP